MKIVLKRPAGGGWLFLWRKRREGGLTHGNDTPYPHAQD